MSRTLEIVTPEHVVIHYELAGVGSRLVAALVDTLAQLLILLLFVVGALVLMQWNYLPEWEEIELSILIGVLVLGYFIILWGYYIAFETLWNGETPGKRWMKLRVIKDGGYPVDFRAVVIRNLLRGIDGLPGIPGIPLYSLGFLALIANSKLQRLGDMAAGTLVVRHGYEETLVRRKTLGEAIVIRLLDTATISQISRLTREEYRILEAFLDHRHEMPGPLQAEFARRLAQQYIEKFNAQTPALGMDHLRWLEELELAYRRHLFGEQAAPVPPPAETPSTPPAPPVETRKW